MPSPRETADFALASAQAAVDQVAAFIETALAYLRQVARFWSFDDPVAGARQPE